MANHKSAIKRIRQNEIRRQRNKIVKTHVKSAVKSVRAAIATGEAAASELNQAKSVIDKAAKKGVIHKRAAARKISRLSRMMARSA